MNIFYSASTGGFYTTEIHGNNLPVDVVEIDAEEYQLLLQGQSLNKSIVPNEEGRPILIERLVTHEYLIIAERNWRNSELAHADIELNKVQDSDPKATGTVAQWREYRKALRAWPEHENFPNKEYRPVSPLIKE